MTINADQLALLAVLFAAVGALVGYGLGRYRAVLRYVRHPIQMLPTMSAGMRTLVTGRNNSHMIFYFKSVEDLHRADGEWRSCQRSARGVKHV